MAATKPVHVRDQVAVLVFSDRIIQAEHELGRTLAACPLADCVNVFYYLSNHLYRGGRILPACVVHAMKVKSPSEGPTSMQFHAGSLQIGPRFVLMDV